MTGKPFTLYTRSLKNGKKIYYIKFKQQDGSYSTGKSTGETARVRAESWAYEYLNKHGSPLPGQDIAFCKYVEDFFSWDGRWALDKRASGKRLSERHCLDTADLVRIHLLPALGSLKLSEITKTVLKQFRNDLFIQGKSSSTINKSLYAIKAVLEMAEEDEIIKGVPKISPVARKQKEKGILSIDEVNRLFSFQWFTTPAFGHSPKPDIIGYTANLLSASSGLRSSEIQGLKISDLHLDNGYIVIRRAWDARLNRLNETTKTGREKCIHS